MSNNKQSSVEWLKSIVKDMIANGGDADLHAVLRHIEQAKAIHKEEIRLIYEGLLQNVGTSIKQDDLPIFEQYYEQTYGGNK